MKIKSLGRCYNGFAEQFAVIDHNKAIVAIYFKNEFGIYRIHFIENTPSSIKNIMEVINNHAS